MLTRCSRLVFVFLLVILNTSISGRDNGIRVYSRDASQFSCFYGDGSNARWDIQSPLYVPSLEYNLVLRNHLLIETTTLFWERTKHLYEDIERLDRKISQFQDFEGVITTARNIQVRRREQIEQLNESVGGAITRLRSNFKLNDRIQQHLESTFWEIDEEDTLNDLKAVEMPPERTLYDLLATPFALRAPSTKSESPFFRATELKETPVSIAPSAVEKGRFAEVRITPKEKIGIFAYYDHDYKLIKYIGLGKNFLPTSSSRGILELREKAFIVVGGNEKKGAMFELLDWDSDQGEVALRIEPYTIPDVPPLQTISRTPDGKYLLTALDATSAWIVELEKDGKTVSRKERIWDGQASPDFLIEDIRGAVNSENEPVIAIVERQIKNQSTHYVQYRSFLLRLDAAWKRNSLTTKSGMRVRDLFALEEGRVALMGSSDRISYPTPPGTNLSIFRRAFIQLLDRHGVAFNAFEVRTNEYPYREHYPEFVAADYDFESKRLAAFRIDKAPDRAFLYLFDDMGRVLEWKKTENNQLFEIYINPLFLAADPLRRGFIGGGTLSQLPSSTPAGLPRQPVYGREYLIVTPPNPAR